MLTLKGALALTLLLPGLARGAACCLGGSPKSFIALQRLQNYELGILTSVRNVWAHYNPYGELEEADRNQTYTVSLGAGARFSDVFDVFLTLPLIYQTNSFGRRDGTRASLGDALAGGEYILVDSLFEDDWYPSVTLSGGMKFPTGTQETFFAGHPLPGTGNGIWEPFLGFSLKKHYGPLTLSVQTSYTVRMPQGNSKEGDAIDLIETASYAFTRRFSFALGAAQNWTLASSEGKERLPNSTSRIAGVFVSPTYFLTRFWSVIATIDCSVPLGGFGMNQPASEGITLTTKYGFF